jgi:exosortase/archaeosortase family protein
MSGIKVSEKAIIIYLVKFATIFCLCYFGTLAMIGLCAPGKYYSAFADRYLDYISVLRASLLHSAKLVSGLFGFETFFVNKYILRVVNGTGIKMVYSCLGIGVMSFWTAFVLANRANISGKIKWLFGGLTLPWLINVLRITFLLIADNRGWLIPFFDHHTWFNMVAYVLIFLLIWLYDKQHKIRPATSQPGFESTS